MREVMEVKTGVDGNAVDSRLELLLDEREIKNCVLRYCHGTDRLDWRTVTECYLPQASDDHGAFRGGPSEFASWLAAKSKYRGAKQHYVANQLVEISGDNAVCESYYCCYIEFIDDRISVVDWTRSLGEPAYWSSPAAAQFTHGRGDDLDPARVAFAELRGQGQ